ncbi:hypothetical protein GCM10023156_64720 [Novipirellula rosea]|uniref:Secreted protein n=1 Tax=Novipirellula rosea TaxID=1031540 RepID=A0ABP8NPZ1_9BACT
MRVVVNFVALIFCHLSTNFVGGEVERSLQRRSGEGADRASHSPTITPFAPELLADSAVAPSPEQRLKGVLDLSPNFVGGEVTAL